MKRVLPLVLSFGLCALAAVLLARLLAAPPAYDPVAYTQQQIAIERAEALAPVDTALAIAWRLVALGAVVGALLILGRHLWLRGRLVRPDAAGVAPVYLEQLRDVSPQALGAFHAAQLAAAERPNVPHSLTYSPHYSAKNDVAAPLALPEAEAPALTLPDMVTLADVLPTLPAGKLCYGMLPGGQPLILSFGEAYHALAAGDTRTGKSNYLDSTIVQLHHQATRYDLRLLIGDFKREMAATWRRSTLVETVETDPAAIADMLVDLAHGEDGILQRYSGFETLGAQHGRVVRHIGDWARVTGQQPRLTFLVLDEINALIEAAEKRNELASALKVVLQTGAGAGVYVLGGAQYLTSRTLGRDGSKQFTTRALFGAFDGTTAGMVFGAGKLADETRALLTGAPGRGVIRCAGQPQPTAFQALRCDEDDILGAVRAITADAPTMPRVVVEGEAQKPPRNAAECTEPGFSISPDIAQIVRRLRAEGKSKKDTISLLWGAKPGSSAAYRQASAAYDAIVAEVVQ